jgi:hypothetical protein
MPLFKYILGIISIISISSCGVEKSYRYKQQHADKVLFENEWLVTDVFFETSEDYETKCSIIFTTKQKQKLALKEIEIKATRFDNPKKVLIPQNFSSLYISKFSKDSNPFYKIFNDINKVDDSLRTFQDIRGHSVYEFTFKDTIPVKNKFVQIDIDIKMLNVSKDSSFLIKKSLFLKRKTEYWFWIFRNC